MTRKPDRGEISRDELAHQVMGGPSTDPHVRTDDELHGGAGQVHVTGAVVSVWRSEPSALIIDDRETYNRYWLERLHLHQKGSSNLTDADRARLVELNSALSAVDTRLASSRPQMEPQPWREADGGEGIYPLDPPEGTPG